MKKFAILVLVLVMALSFTACSMSETSVEAYVKAHEDEMIDGFNSGFASGSGLDCETTVEGEGNNIIFTTCINDLEDLSDEEKELYQSTFDSMNAQLKTSFAGVKNEVPDIEKLIINICEADGDEIAEIVIEY